MMSESVVTLSMGAKFGGKATGRLPTERQIARRGFQVGVSEQDLDGAIAGLRSSRPRQSNKSNPSLPWKWSPWWCIFITPSLTSTDCLHQPLVGFLAVLSVKYYVWPDRF
jgi:hypothetical protein